MLIGAHFKKEDSLIRPEGITEVEARKLAKKYKKIRIHQIIPFAPFLFLGAVLSYITKSNIIIFIMNSIP